MLCISFHSFAQSLHFTYHITHKVRTCTNDYHVKIYNLKKKNFFDGKISGNERNADTNVVRSISGLDLVVRKCSSLFVFKNEMD